MSFRLNRLDSRGKAKLGCVLALLVVAFIGYYGIDTVDVYLDYVQMKDAMDTQARLAASVDDGRIRRILVDKAGELELPEEAKKFNIRRRSSPHEILISTSWEATLDFSPFFQIPWEFEHEARAPL